MFEKLTHRRSCQYEIVYEILARKAVSTNRKIVILNAYLRFLDFKEIPPKYVPRYTRIESLPFVPTENKIDSLISSLGGRKISTMFLIAKETGARLGEIWSFKWHDIDFEKATVSINSPEKNSDPRQLRVSQKLLNMLRKLLKETNTSLDTIKKAVENL